MDIDRLPLLMRCFREGSLENAVPVIASFTRAQLGALLAECNRYHGQSFSAVETLYRELCQRCVGEQQQCNLDWALADAKARTLRMLMEIRAAVQFFQECS